MQLLTDKPLYLKALVYGNFGVGKTQLAGTAADVPEMRDVLFVVIEDGTLTVRHKDHIEASNPIRTVQDVEKLFWVLATSPKKIKTVVLDSGTDLVQLCREEVVAKGCKSNPSKDPDIITIRDHGSVNFILSRLFRMFRDLPMNVIITALVREEYNTDDPEQKMIRGPVRCTPAFPPMLGNRVMAYVDHVWSIHRLDDGSRALMTQPRNGWVAKTRGEVFAAALGPHVVNPTLPTIMQKLQESVTK